MNAEELQRYKAHLEEEIHKAIFGRHPKAWESPRQFTGFAGLLSDDVIIKANEIDVVDPMAVCPIHGLPLWQCRSNGCNCPENLEKAS